MGVTTVKYGDQHNKIERLLRKVNRPGEYVVHGSLVAPMPRVELASVGVVPLPVNESVAASLLEVAEQAPYGRGPDTLVDTSVRNCWQIDSEEVQVGGAGWKKTMASILNKIAAGLGCPRKRLRARLHKLLVYEKGGFFAEHRDTEKEWGMVATLVISLPATGVGAELVVRHNGRESVIDMCTSDPSVLVYAAFYADCSHETLPLREGHRVALVYNLILTGYPSAAMARAPVYSEQINAIGAWLADWTRQDNSNNKIAWVLDHSYSAARLSFDLFKGIDAAVAQVLSEAARLGGCSLHAAILHIKESGTPDYETYGYYDEIHYEDAVLFDIEDYSCWLDGWAAEDGSSPEFGKVSVGDGELLPTVALDDALPDDSVVHEATGNWGISVDHTYLNAALVMWPKRRTVRVLSDSSMDGAIRYVEARVNRKGPGKSTESVELISQLIKSWPSQSNYYPEHGGSRRAKMLNLLSIVPHAEETREFVETIVLPRYSGQENDGLIAVAKSHGAQVMAGLLPRLIESKLGQHLSRVADLTWRLIAEFGAGEDRPWLDVLEAAARKMTEALPENIKRHETTAGKWRRTEPESLTANSVATILRVGWRFGLDRDMAAVARRIVEEPCGATPDRVIPVALSMLQSAGHENSSKGAFWILWNHAAEFLLARSAEPPGPPRDWYVDARIPCNCEACRTLQTFCMDRRAKTRTFAMRQKLRSHLQMRIRTLRLPMDHETVRQGSPHKLVCTKTWSVSKQRLEEYAEDVEHMRMLVDSAPTPEAEGQGRRYLGRLESALSRDR